MDNPAPPSQEEIQELLDQGKELLEKLVHYRGEASKIDNQVIDSTNSHVPLDNLPYGEELIRTEQLPTQVQEAIDKLATISEGHLSPEDAVEEFENSEEAIQSAQDTLDDCREIPDSDSDEDEDEEDLRK
jgi:phospholipid N-methyltransferase